MSRKRYDHEVHKYERVRLGSKKTGHEVYKCALANCNHYVMDMELTVGRLSLCWEPNCPNALEMTRDLIFNRKIKWPVCPSCKERRKFYKSIETVPLPPSEELDALREKILKEVEE